MKKIIIISLSVVLVVLAISIYFIFIKEKPDNIKFKEEYESLNGEKVKGKKVLNITVEKDNLMKYATYEEIMNFLENGTGIIYFGFPECPWCRNAVGPIIKAAKNMELEEIYYFNALEMRDVKELKDGKVKTVKEGKKEYYELLDALKDVIGPYDGLEDESIKRLYFPSMVFVMGGKIVGFHEGTVDSQKDPSKPLTKKQEKELIGIYEENINKIYGVCDESC